MSSVREVFIPRPGFVLCSVDYSALELRTLAQVCIDMLGYSALAEAFRAGRDPHLELAAELLGISFEECETRFAAGDPIVIEARQQAKPPNFGFPGGLGILKFIAFALASYEVRFTVPQATETRARWRARWPEVPEFQKRVGASIDSVTGTTDVIHVRSKRVRAGCKYTEACNSFFQGLAADGAKDALYRVTRDGAEHGVYPIAFIHDEILAEIREDVAHEGAHWMRDVMVKTMQEWCPNVPIEAEPALARRWYKKMAPRFENGRLVPWEPSQRAAA